jgi:GlpG protein
MRQVGTFATQSEAQRFVDYLLTLGVQARVESAAGGHSIWIYDENDVERARQALDELRLNPSDPRFEAAGRQAAKLREAQVDSRRLAEKNVVNLSERWRTRGSRHAPLTVLLIALSVAVTLAANFGRRNEVAHWLWLSEIGPQLIEVRSGQLWRLFTPMLLHLGMLHLLFDMYWLYILGSLIEVRRGTLILAMLVFGSELVTALSQAAVGAPNFAGMSGVDYALFGYCWIKTRFDPGSGIFIDSQTVLMMMIWLLICLFNLSGMPQTANAAHVSGLAAGLLFGYVPLLLKKR